MPFGRSLHIGLNRIDSAHYGTSGSLSGCENDANAMQRLASSLGYRAATLLTAAARADAILTAISTAATELNAGDTFLLTYAGHGAQIDDTNSDEADKMDETWCVYDRMIIDDELRALWANFKAGVLIVMVSDSCHSGTMLRNLVLARINSRYITPVHDVDFNLRTLDPEYAYQNNRQLYDEIQSTTAVAARSVLGAGGILLSGCQDNQLSSDGNGGNGLFTERLLRIWDEGRFKGDYPSFIKAIQREMPPNQTPNYATFGDVSAFETKHPFTISISGLACPTHKSSKSDQTVTQLQQSTQTQQKENNMTSFIDNGNWEEVFEGVSQQLSQTRGESNFLAQVIKSNAQAAEAAYSRTSTGVNGNTSAYRGGSVIRAFWWGFHIQVSHEDLLGALNATDPNGEIVRFLRRLMQNSDYRYWIDIIAQFVIVTGNLLRSLDRGRGIYISMSWFAPGVFVPTTV